MEKGPILLIEGDEHEAANLRAALNREGFELLWASDGDAGLSLLQSQTPLLVLLDPDGAAMDGFELCRTIRAQSPVPIIMVTARNEEIDCVVGLEVGADDYVVKPYSLRELIARIRALLRRAAIMQRLGPPQPKIVYPGLEIDRAARTVRMEGKTVPLTPKEFALLYFLISRAGQALSREEIFQELWGYTPTNANLRTIDAHIKRLRAKLRTRRPVPWAIATVWGVGYRFDYEQ